MTKTFKFLAVTAVLAVATTAAHAADVIATANATVVGSISIQQTQGLNFGSFSAGSTAGTINHYGVTEGGVNYSSGASFPEFSVTGQPNTNFNITAPTTVTLSNGANSMIATLSDVPSQLATDDNGSSSFSFGAKLNVGANQPAGAYSGTYSVSANY